MREWKSLAAELADSLNGTLPDDAAETVKNSVALHKAILSGIPRQIAQYDKNERVYRDMAGRAFTVFPGSGLAKLKNAHPQIMYFTVMETRMRFARICSVIDAAYLLETAPHLCRASYSDIHYDENSGFVYAKEKVTCGNLIVIPGRRVHYGKISPAETRQVFLRDGVASGKIPKKSAPWVRRLLDDIELLRQFEQKMRRPESIVDENALYELLTQTLPDSIMSVNDIKEDFKRNRKNYLIPAENFVYDEAVFRELDDYPDELFCGKIKAQLEYRFDPGEKQDGITLLIKEDDVPLFDPHLPDYLVPGWLKRKVDILLRSLPKSLRREITPVSDAVDDLCRKIRSKSIICTRSLADTAIEYLANEYGLELGAAAFDNIEFPEFLIMKVAVTDGNGKIKAVHKGFPERSRIGNRLSGAVSAQCGIKNKSANNSEWPAEGVLEYEVIIPDAGSRKGYPALCIEQGNVTSAVFLNERDALFHHRNAITKLIREKYKQECSYWLKKCKFSNNARLTVFLNSPDPAEDLLEAAISMSLPTDAVDIRSAGAFEMAGEAAKPEIGANMSKLQNQLEDLCFQIDHIKTAIKKLPGSSFCRRDAEAELKFFFRPGFLKTPEAFTNYPRYLKSLTLRLERAAGGGCIKDENKAANISPWAERFFLAVQSCDISRNPQLTEFYLLLEEARIAAFTPELRCNVKSAASKLENAWNCVKLK